MINMLVRVNGIMQGVRFLKYGVKTRVSAI